jgi:hypothetical protein
MNFERQEPASGSAVAVCFAPFHFVAPSSYGSRELAYKRLFCYVLAYLLAAKPISNTNASLCVPHFNDGIANTAPVKEFT